MKTYSASTGSYTETPFQWQKLEMTQNRLLSGGHPILDFDAADNCRLYIATMTEMNLQENINSIAIDKFIEHYVVVFDSTSKQDAIGNCQYPELVEEPH